jgi:hypothetical protein
MPKETILGCGDVADKHDQVDVDVRWGGNGVQISTQPRGTVGEGYLATLDRTAINDLIRNLRKARDREYGADA